ncbi:MAG: hypothetical protein ABSE62_09425 [Chthoniobacteraceae bacterium]|jgi:hypothetical protein
MTGHHRHRHGNPFVGRIIVAVACLFLLGADLIICKAATRPGAQPDKLGVAITFMLLGWIYSGAIATCARKLWGRVLMLTLIYIATIYFFISTVILLNSRVIPKDYAKALIFGTVIYLVVSLVLTRSKDVRRLTSRVWE